MTMLQINDLHANVGDKATRNRGSFLLVMFGAALLAGCGDLGFDSGAAEKAGKLLTVERVAAHLPPEARAVVTSYEGDLRSAVSAYQAEFGRLPDSLADLGSLAGAREAAVTIIADGIGEQIPFASRETINNAANGVVSAAERQILEQMSAQNAPNP